MFVHGSPSDTKSIHIAGACDQQDVPPRAELLAASADHHFNLPLQTQSEDCHLVCAVFMHNIEECGLLLELF